MCVSDPASTPNLDSRGHCSLHKDMEERKSQWPSRAITVKHITAAHVTIKGMPVYSSWACWEWGWIAICAPAALPPSHHGANLVHSLCLRGWVIDRWQLSSEIFSFRLLQHRERVKMLQRAPSLKGQPSGSHPGASWKQSTQKTWANHGNPSLPLAFGRLGLSWRCEGGVTNVGHLSCWHQWDVSSNTLTNLKLWMCGAGDRVLKLQQ